MASVLDLPGELIAQVFRYLRNDDIFAARQASRRLETASFAFFAKHFFRKKGYMITSPSLDVLQHVAGHRELRKYVQHVWFNPDCFTWVTSDCVPYGDDCSELDALERRQYTAYTACMLDYESLLCTEKLSTRLESIFRDLPNLEVIGMRRSEDHIPWGCWRLKEAVGEDPRVLDRTPSSLGYALSRPTYLFIGLITSIAAAGLELKRLYTDAIQIDYIKSEHLPAETLSKVCQSILYIELTATQASLAREPDADYNISRDTSLYGNGLVKLLTATSQLREISLMVFSSRAYPFAPRSDPPTSGKNDYRYLVLEKLADIVRLKHLRRVKLEKLTTSVKSLMSFLRPCKAQLESLKLRDIKVLSVDAEDRRPWRSFFTFLRDECPKLSCLLMYHLAYDQGGIRFVETLPPRSSRDTQVPGLQTVANGGDFTDYEKVKVDVQGRQVVARKLEEITERHWYGHNVFSYAMDNDLWYTDTSDEEW